MIESSRREVLIGGAVLGVGVAALGSFAVAQRVGVLPEAATYEYFTPAEAAFVEAAVDRLIPAEPEWPGALLAGVSIYIDRQLAGPYGAGQRLYLEGPIREGTSNQGYQLGLPPRELYRTAIAAIGPRFANLPPEEQDAFLKTLEAGQVPMPFNSAVFFETLLANTIEGYFADPIYGGNRDMMAWRMIGFPGSHAAYLGVYTQHGIHFDREPLSIGTEHHRAANRHQPVSASHTAEKS